MASTNLSFATVLVDVSIIYKRGIDKDLVLVSELHSREHIYLGQEINLQMKDNLRLKLKGEFLNEVSAYGPNENVKFMGVLYAGKGEDYLRSKRFEIILPLNLENKKIFKNDTGELIEIHLKPFVQNS